jgi:hypothetical protein
MNLDKRLHIATLLAAVFSVSFATMFSAVLLTQPTHSTPAHYVLTIDGMEITLGPPPNSTEVPIDTTITIDALASAALNDLHITPDVLIARVYSEVTGPLTYLNTFYPAHLLKPATEYNVSVTILGRPVSWTFETSTKPFSSEINLYLATNVSWIALATAILATSFAGFVIWIKRTKPRLR